MLAVALRAAAFFFGVVLPGPDVFFGAVFCVVVFFFFPVLLVALPAALEEVCFLAGVLRPVCCFAPPLPIVASRSSSKLRCRHSR